MKKIVANTETIVGGKTFQPGEVIASYDVAHGLSFDSALGALANGTAKVVVDGEKQPAPPQANEPSPATETVDDPSSDWDGLDASLVAALQANEFTSKAEVQSWVDEGNDLNDLDRIGQAKKVKILAWLNS